MSREPGRPRSVLRSGGLLVAWFFVAVGAGLALLYAVPELQQVHRWAALVAAFIPFGVLAWALAVVLFVAAGSGWGRVLAVLAVPGLAAQLAWASGYVPAETLAAGRVGTSVMTLNMRCDSSGREELAATLLERQPDLVVVQGAPKQLREHLAEAGVFEVYPHRLFFPMLSLPSCGSVVYSKVPVVETAASTPEQPAVRGSWTGGRRRTVRWRRRACW